MGAADVVLALEAAQDDAELAKVRKRLAPDEPAFGVRMGTLFAVAKAHQDLSLGEVEQLLSHEPYEPRMAAFCILDYQARQKDLDDAGRQALFDCYLGHHDRITTWDMVDRAAPRVVGAVLLGGPYDLLHELADSGEALRRRTAITAPLLFVASGSDADVAEGCRLAIRLGADPDPLVHLAAGTFLKHAGGRDPDAVAALLDQHGDTMVRPAVRAAVSKLDPEAKERILG